MSLINSRQNKTKAELRKYGLVMFAAFGVISGLLFWQERPAWVFTAVPSLLFLVFALAFPGALAPVEKFWMKLAAVLGYIMTNVLLSLVFVLAIIPTGFILRILGKTPIKKGFAENSSSNSNLNSNSNSNSNSYWIEVDKNGPCSRPEKPY